eukprot:3221833-Pyramimonas_sp.AAC.1
MTASTTTSASSAASTATSVARRAATETRLGERVLWTFTLRSELYGTGKPPQPPLFFCCRHHSLPPSKAVVVGIFVRLGTREMTTATASSSADWKAAQTRSSGC